jgi:hypothetical protein
MFEVNEDGGLDKAEEWSPLSDREMGVAANWAHRCVRARRHSLDGNQGAEWPVAGGRWPVAGGRGAGQALGVDLASERGPPGILAYNLAYTWGVPTPLPRRELSPRPA